MFGCRLKSPCIVCIAAIWAAGVFVAWYFAPPGPRWGWQPTGNEIPIGFLSDSTSVVTEMLIDGGESANRAAGPTRVRNINTGQIVAVHEPPSEFTVDVLRFGAGDDLIAYRALLDRGNGGGPSTFEVTLINALTGARINSFETRMQVQFDRQFPGINVSPDGRFIGIQDWIDNMSAVVLYETATGRRIASFTGNTSIAFSPRGEIVVVAQADAMIVYDLVQGRVLRELPNIITKEQSVNYPHRISRDGNLLLDDANRVWEIATGRLRFQLAAGQYGCTEFAPDGRHVVTLTGTQAESWLEYFDIETGAEDTSRRLPLTRGDGESRWGVVPATDSSERLLVKVHNQISEPSIILKLRSLARYFRFQTRPSNMNLSWTSLVVDAGASRELLRGRTPVNEISPDGKHFLTVVQLPVDGFQWHCRIYDLPPARDWRWVAAGVVIWSFVVAAILYVRQRIRRRADPSDEPAGDPPISQIDADFGPQFAKI